jgi:signal transduction histidine kinase
VYTDPFVLGPDLPLSVRPEDPGRTARARKKDRITQAFPRRRVDTAGGVREGDAGALAPARLDGEQNEDMLGVLAHELRNPLTGLSGILQLVRGSLQMGKPVEMDDLELLETAQAEVGRLNAILSSVVDADRRRGQALQLERIACDLREIVKAAVRPMLRGTHPIMMESDQPGPATVYVDRHRLEQVFRNLLGNAAKYSPPDSVIRLALRRVQDGIMTSIRDDGIGIPPEEAERIFDRFYRAHNVQGQDPGGAGLGLYLCRRIVEAHGGRIWADRSIRQGATIHVLLPTSAV